jgi:hypothetical protein
MLRRFFQDYKQLEGKAVEVDEIQPAAEAYPIINDALHRYSEQRRKASKDSAGTKDLAFPWCSAFRGQDALGTAGGTPALPSEPPVSRTVWTGWPVWTVWSWATRPQLLTLTPILKPTAFEVELELRGRVAAATQVQQD